MVPNDVNTRDVAGGFSFLASRFRCLDRVGCAEAKKYSSLDVVICQLAA